MKTNQIDTFCIMVAEDNWPIRIHVTLTTRTPQPDGSIREESEVRTYYPIKDEVK